MPEVSERHTTKQTIGIAVSLFLGISLMGTIGYMALGDLSVIDAFYMTIITISTVGFREVSIQEFTLPEKLFTIFLILSSIGTIAYVGSTMIAFVTDGELRYYLKIRKVEKEISQLKNHVIIVGFGRNGEQAAMELLENGMQCVVIEKRENVVEHVKEIPGLLYIKGDATQEDVLEKAKIHAADALIVTLPQDADSVFVVLTVRNMNPDISIISRASEVSSVKKLELAGATNVIMPELIGGQQMAKLVHQPDILEFMDNVLLQRVKDVQLVEIACKNMSDSFDGKSIGELKIREHSGVNIIGIKSGNMKYIFNPDASTVLFKTYKLFVMGNNPQIANLKKWLESGC